MKHSFVHLFSFARLQGMNRAKIGGGEGGGGGGGGGEDDGEGETMGGSRGKERWLLLHLNNLSCK